jgi:hypothetical protein
LFAWSGPLRVPSVRAFEVSPPLNVLSALNVFVVVVEKAVEKTPVELLYASG